MTRAEALAYIHEWLKDEYALNSKDRESLDMAIEALELVTSYEDTINKLTEAIANTQEPKTGHCKNCKYFEYDSVEKVNGIPLIASHEICKKWGDGCKTREDGYCFLYESQESEE